MFCSYFLRFLDVQPQNHQNCNNASTVSNSQKPTFLRIYLSYIHQIHICVRCISFSSINTNKFNFEIASTISCLQSIGNLPHFHCNHLLLSLKKSLLIFAQSYFLDWTSGNFHSFHNFGPVPFSCRPQFFGAGVQFQNQPGPFFCDGLILPFWFMANKWISIRGLIRPPFSNPNLENMPSGGNKKEKERIASKEKIFKLIDNLYLSQLPYFEVGFVWRKKKRIISSKAGLFFLDSINALWVHVSSIETGSGKDRDNYNA